MSGLAPMRVGIIGTGNIAANHAWGHLAAGAMIAAITDTAPTTLARRAAEWGVGRAFATTGSCWRCRTSMRSRCARRTPATAP